jgi:HSP20 family molecular chaperone IbpA
MLELPGVKKSEVRVTLSTCYYNRVKQVTVYGRTRPVFPVSAFPEGIDGPPDLTVRERKFGDFSRTFAVPSETKVRSFSSSSTPPPRTLCILPAPHFRSLFSFIVSF